MTRLLLVGIGILCLNSFAGATLVVLADGSRVPIVDVAVGDSVAAFDTATGDVVSGPVTGVLSHTDSLVDVVLSDGSTLSMTGDHSVYDTLSGSWRPVSEFESDGALLGLSGGTLTVTGFLCVADHVGPVQDAGRYHGSGRGCCVGSCVRVEDLPDGALMATSTTDPTESC